MLTFQEKREHLMTVILRARSLSTLEKMVSIAIIFKVDSDGRCHLTQRELCELSSTTRPSLQRVIRGLEKKIQLDVERGRRKNTYRLYQWRLL
jgi:DNA-binding MarR family transcriptional regulator